MAGLIVPVSGPYTGTYGATTMGILSDDGYKITGTWLAQEIGSEGTDAYGLTLLDFINRGQNWGLVVRGQDYAAGLLAALHQWGHVAAATFDPILAQVGNDALNGFTSAIVLTATLSNPPTTPVSLTASNASLAPNNSTELLYTSKLRELPVSFVFLPYTASSNKVWFSVT
jgi:hypothetical protein